MSAKIVFFGVVQENSFRYFFFGCVFIVLLFRGFGSVFLFVFCVVSGFVFEMNFFVFLRLCFFVFVLFFGGSA